jgi:hypothetical protein
MCAFDAWMRAVIHFVGGTGPSNNEAARIVSRTESLLDTKALYSAQGCPAPEAQQKPQSLKNKQA